MNDIWSNPRTAGGRNVAKYGIDSKPNHNRDLGTMLIPQKENTVYTDRYGKTIGDDAITVISLDTRITEAFAEEGVVPSPAARREVTRLVKFLPMLTAEKAVLLYLDGARAPHPGVA